MALVVPSPTVVGSEPGVPEQAAFRPLDLAPDRCKGCGLCVATCPQGVLELDVAVVNTIGHHPVAIVDEAACTSCALCARVCPDAVIDVYARPKGARA